MYFHSVLFIIASCSVWIMPCFGSKGFKSSKHVVGDKLSLQIQFLLSINQIALVFTPVGSISCSGETRPARVQDTGHWTGELLQFLSLVELKQKTLA